MKVLFLDIDGVVNSSSTTDFRNNLWPVDPYMAFLVGRIQLYTGCEVVLSSSWRYHPDGLAAATKIVSIYSMTPKINSKRGIEIADWLNERDDVERYAILDDDDDMLKEQLPNFFKTSFKTGLTDDIANAVIEHLNS